MSFPARTPFEWKLRTRSLALGPRTLIMGILNVTPDSFSDGGRYLSSQDAVRQALQMLDDGAGILDLGGESTRPNAKPINPDEEQARVLPALRAILQARPDAILSIDTYHAETARRAVEAGAQIVNDVSGFTWDLAMPAACAALGCGVVLMHTRGRPSEWSTLPPLPAVAIMPVTLTGLRDSILAARSAGIAADRLLLDPGLGFGKHGEENYPILALLGQLRQFGLPVLVGSSRKGFLRATVASRLGGSSPAADSPASLHASLAATVVAILAGAHIVRVHDVRPAVEAVAIADAILAAGDHVAAEASGFTRTSSRLPQ